MNQSVAEGILAQESLVEKARLGERKAYDALVLRYQRQVILMAHSILRNWELAKDASQNAFAKAYFRLDQLKDNRIFKTWLFRIVINEAKDVLRKEKVRGLFRFWRDRET